MTGKELRAILKFNRIAYVSFAYMCGYKSKYLTNDLVRLDRVPSRYIIILGNYLKVNLLIRENLDKVLEEIPKRYFEDRKTSIKAKGEDLYYNIYDMK